MCWRFGWWEKTKVFVIRYHILAFEIMSIYHWLQEHENVIWFLQGEIHTSQALERWQKQCIALSCNPQNQVVIQKAKYIVVNYDEVITIDNQSWCSLHVYIVDRFKWVALLLNLERVFNKSTIDNLPQLIFRSLMEYGDLIAK